MGFATLAMLVALTAWVARPETDPTGVLQIVAGAALFLRLMRWRGPSAGAEPLLFVLHLGYGWLASGLLLTGANELIGFMDPTSGFHTLTAGAIGTMMLAVMTRATRGHRVARSSPIVEQSLSTSP